MVKRGSERGTRSREIFCGEGHKGEEREGTDGKWADVGGSSFGWRGRNGWGATSRRKSIKRVNFECPPSSQPLE